MASLRTYSLGQLLNLLTGQVIGDSTFHLGNFTGQNRPLPYPYRIQGYAIGVTMSGWLEGSLNLDTFQISPGKIMIIAPQQIHRILACSPDFAMRTLFFTDAFLMTTLRDSAPLATLALFQPSAPAVLSVASDELERVMALLAVIEQYYWPIDLLSQRPAGHVLQAILADLNQIYQKKGTGTSEMTTANRPAELANRFRQLVTNQYLTTRQVADYANQMAVSTKHLSETVKSQTGKPASAWIDAMVIQEAQVLLSQTNSSLSQIADYLQFGTQSAFGKFFRKQTGISPKSFRQKP